MDDLSIWLLQLCGGLVMTKSYETLNELIEESAKKAEKAKEIVAKSQAKRLKDEHIWRRSYDNAH